MTKDNHTYIGGIVELMAVERVVIIGRRYGLFRHNMSEPGQIRVDKLNICGGAAQASHVLIRHYWEDYGVEVVARAESAGNLKLKRTPETSHTYIFIYREHFGPSGQKSTDLKGAGEYEG